LAIRLMHKEADTYGGKKSHHHPALPAPEPCCRVLDPRVPSLFAPTAPRRARPEILSPKPPGASGNRVHTVPHFHPFEHGRAGPESSRREGLSYVSRRRARRKRVHTLSQ